MAEEYNIFDPHQEGFRHRRSTARQAQALAWDQDDAQTGRLAINTAYIDFCMAFNSMDQEALWCWMIALGFHVDDLLRNIYKDTTLGTCSNPPRMSRRAPDEA